MKRLSLALLFGFIGISMSIVACSGDSTPPSEPNTPAATEDGAPAARALDFRPTGGGPSEAAAGATESPEAAAPAERPRLVAAIRGVAEIGYLRPATKSDGNEVVTTIQIKNLATGAIAGLKIDEFWYDRDGNPLGGASERLGQPLMPGEEVTVELRVPSSPRMNRSNYTFSHQNGDIKATELAAFRQEGES